MAESSLSVGWPELRQEVGYFLKYGRTINNWTAAQVIHIDGCVHSGVRQVYYPSAIQGSEPGYEWSWLRLSATLDIYSSYATGTVTIVSGVVTLADGIFPSWAADGELTIDSVAYSVNTRDGDTQVTLDDTSVDADAGSSYSLAQADYDLPDDFGRLVGEFHYAPDEYRRSIEQISVGKLLAKRAHSNLSGAPQFCAVRYKESDGATGQRQEVLFYPEADEDWTLAYEAEAYSGELSNTYPYPLGGMQLAELYIESCLAIAEQRYTDEVGLHTQRCERLLLDAVARDRKRSARYYGQMGGGEIQLEKFQRGRTGGTYPITYKGSSI